MNINSSLKEYKSIWVWGRRVKSDQKVWTLSLQSVPQLLVKRTPIYVSEPRPTVGKTPYGITRILKMK